MKRYDITPFPKPRMTVSDKWKKRKCVLAYRAFCDEVRLKSVDIDPEGYWIEFILPVPKGLSKKERAARLGAPHRQKPDKDNLEKALLDAVFKEDSICWRGGCSKTWAASGAIIVHDIVNHNHITQHA